MLEIKRLIKTDEPGFQGVFLIQDQNLGFLLNYAINSLLKKGTLAVLDIEQSDFDSEDSEDSPDTTLAVMSTQNMFNA